MWQVAAGVVSGACVALVLPATVPAAVTLAAGGTLGFAGAWLRRAWLVAGACGLLLGAWQLHARLADRLDPELEGSTVSIRGTVVSVPQGTLQALKFRVAPLQGDPTTRVPRLLELTWYDAPTRVLAGEDVELEVKLRRPRGFSNPGGHDNEARMLRDGVGASGYVRFGQRLGRRPDAISTYPVLMARARVAHVIREVLGQRASAGIVTGLAVGLQDAVSREQWLALSRSGTSHLMAISGLHITMVAALVAWAGSAVQRWRQRRGSIMARRDVAVIAGALAALGYGALAGSSIPTQRTLIMIACGAAALCARRRVAIADGLGLCAAAVVILDPLAPLAPGFWLSFGAVAAILFGATGYVTRPSWWRSYLHLQGIVTLGLVPVLIGSFGSVSLVSALVNLVAIPLYTLGIVPLVLISCATALAWPEAGSLLLRMTGALIETTWPLIEVPASWPLATWAVAGLEPIAWIALTLGTLALLAPLPAAGRAAGLAMVAVACCWRSTPVATGAAAVTILDVGQGLSVVVETRQHVLVYDTGPSFHSGSNTGQLVVAPYLRHRGIRAIDRVVVTHDDDDHQGGAASLMELFPTAQLVTGPSIRAGRLPTPPGAERAACRRGARWEWDGVQFEWLHPGSEPYERDNDSSCVLLLRAGEHEVLLTGDIEAAAEGVLVASGAIQQADIVLAPHHGSRTSSTAPFVTAARPEWIIYAAGYRNRWRFPVASVVARWEGIGARGLVTGTSGAITFELQPGLPLPEPRQWRRERMPPWRDP